MSKNSTSFAACVLVGLMSLGPAFAQKVISTDPAAADNVNPENSQSMAAAAPVQFRGQTLFSVSAPIGELSTAQRAAAIEKRLQSIASGSVDVLETLQVTERNGRSEITAGDVLIRTVTDQDAERTGRTRQQLAADQLTLIRDALAVEFRDRGVVHVLRGLGIAVLATIALVAVLVGLRKLYRFIYARLSRAAREWHWQSGLAKLKLISPAAVARATRSTATAVASLIGLGLAYFYLEFVLSLFPWTRGIAEQMVVAATAAVKHVFLGLFNYLPSVINIAVIIIVTRYILKALKGLFEQVSTGNLTIAGFHPEWGHPTYALVRFFVIAIAAIMVFPYLPGSGSQGFQGVSAFVGLMISFGAAPAIGNAIAGVIITYMRPFRIGDRVKIADAVGDVTGKTLLVVRLRTIKNVDITIPNALVLANHIINFSSTAAEQGLILNTSVTIGYDAPWRTVHQLLIDAAKRVDGVLAEPVPFVLQTSLDDFYVAYEINAYTNRPNEQATLYSKLHAEIQDAFNKGGIEILSPHYSAMRDGNQMAVPTDYLPKDYKAPSFSILSRILRPGQGT